MKNLLIIGAVFIISFLPRTAVGQTPEEQRRIEVEKILALEKTELKILEGEERLVIDYGGWANFRYDGYNDDDNNSSLDDPLKYTYAFDFRFWMKAALRPPADMSYPNEHSIYIRWKNIHTERRPSDINSGHDHDGPDVDYAYLLLDFRPYWVEVGRRYFSVGQGIAYSNVSDGIEFLASPTDWNLKAFVSHTLPGEDNIDTSVPGWENGSDRIYYGLEGTYLGIPNHGIYGYLLIQRDNTDEDPTDVFNNYTYDSEYFGLGAQGKIFPGMHYWAEIIRETGKSCVYGTEEKRDIKAWAGDFGITYDLDVYSQPNFSAEYAFGTGDPGRTSVTNTEGGNVFGDDRNFLYFGYLPAGYAFSPRLSNLHFYKTGVLLKPLEKFHLFRNLTFGADYYWYYKDAQAGEIYDSDATASDSYIGSEVDLNLSWQILSDLSCTLQYGHFNPGDTYPDSTDDNENYFSVSTTLMF